MYLEQLACSARNGFEKRFSDIALNLCLDDRLSEHELGLLYEATTYATFCNIAFNGLGGCGGEIKPKQEAHRINLERTFMKARADFCASPGWGALRNCTKEAVQRIFLNVFVADDNLA